MTVDVSRETWARLAELEQLVVEESTKQNLISSNSIPNFQERHVRDSLQLLPYLPDGVIVDIGSGAGFPGLVLACCRDTPIHLVEPRLKRASFLEHAVHQLGLGGHTIVHQRKIERVVLPAVAAITARAVGHLLLLFEIGAHLSDKSTRWVLPKGRTARSELEDAQRTWHGVFHVEPSITDPDAAIVIAEGVRRRRGR